MRERAERTAVSFLVGSLPPVLVVVWLGLLNEGFSSIAFLFYPGPETWLQAGLTTVFLILLALSLSAFHRAFVQGARTAPIPMLVTSLVGFALASGTIYAIGMGETPWRKSLTYAVAPRAMSAWLLCAILVLALVLSRPQARNHAA
jgi:hypothetical protein